MAAALTSTSQVTHPTSTSPVTEGFGAEKHASIRMTFLITVAFIHSGSYLLALSIVVMPARVACASVYEDTKTTDTTDRDAEDSFDDENDFVNIKIMYMHLKEEEVFEEECGRVCAQLYCHTTAVLIP